MIAKFKVGSLTYTREIQSAKPELNRRAADAARIQSTKVEVAAAQRVPVEVDQGRRCALRFCAAGPMITAASLYSKVGCRSLRR